MKRCNKCDDDKALTEFYVGDSRCKECIKELNRKRYLANREHFIEKNRKRRRRLTKFIRNMKEQVGCISCDESRGICLDFHHEDPEDKEFEIHQSCGLSEEKLIEEMKKCIVVCANCHRILHAKYEY